MQRASELGPSVEAFATKLFEGPLPWAKMRQGQKLLKPRRELHRRPARCAFSRALAFDLADVRRLQRAPSTRKGVPSKR